MSSSIVRKGRNIWTLAPWPIAPDRIIELRWRELLVAGHGTAHQRTHLLSSLKGFFNAAFADTGDGRTYAPTTLLQNFVYLKTLCRWMIERDIWGLSKLTASDLIDFFKCIKPRSSGQTVSAKTIDNWIVIFGRMWALKARYPHPLKVDVHRLVDEIRTQVRTRGDIPWKALDDDVALALIRDSIEWLEEFAPFVAKVVSDSWQQQLRYLGYSRAGRRDAAEAFYETVERTAEFARLKAALAYEGSPQQVMSIALSLTEGACLTLLLLLIGFRVSEAVALDEDCLRPDVASDGEVVDYLHGPGAKMKGRVRRWVAGAPIRSVVECLLMLTKLSRSQTISKTRALTLSRARSSNLFTPFQAPIRISDHLVVKRLKEFACSGLRKGKLQAKKFHPHMARKTFAQLAVRRDKRNLEPVSTHLGHAYREFTDGKYVGIDHSLAQLLDEEDRRELASGLVHLLTCDNLGGGAAPSLAAAREHVRAFPGKKTLNALVMSLVAKGVALAPCDWGYCVYSKVSSACRGDDRGPNELHRSPEVCSGCKNFTVTPRHLPWWEDRVAREESFLKQNDLPEQTRALVMTRLSKSKNVLAQALWLTAP